MYYIFSITFVTFTIQRQKCVLKILFCKTLYQNKLLIIWLTAFLKMEHL